MTVVTMMTVPGVSAGSSVFRGGRSGEGGALLPRGLRRTCLLATFREPRHLPSASIRRAVLQCSASAGDQPTSSFRARLTFKARWAGGVPQWQSWLAQNMLPARDRHTQQ